jgi:energy-coupling factor transport system substrate-specific component
MALLLAVFNTALGYSNSHILRLPLFLDTIGTLVSTALLGLIPGLITAVVTHTIPHLLPFLPSDFIHWVFCSIASALALRLFIRYGLFENMLHAITVSVVVTLANALVGAVTAVFFFSGLTDHPVDYLMTGFLTIGQDLLGASFWSRIPVNLIDKGIAVFIALGLYRWCRKNTPGTEQG